MAAKSGGKAILAKTPSRLCRYPSGKKYSRNHSNSFSEINAFYAEIQDGCQKWRGNHFCENSPVESAHTLWFKNFVEIALASSVSEINPFFAFYAEIQDGRQKWQKNTEVQDGRQKWRENKSSLESAYTLWIKNLVEISLSLSKIKMFLCFTQKLKMAAKCGGITIFGKSRQ